MEKLRCLSAFQQRKAAAILGGLVADAAISPLHWIYDQEKVDSLIKKEGRVEFYPSSQCPYYNIPCGNNSTYGDQLYVTLKNIAENKGFDSSKLADTIFNFFGPGTEYERVRLQTESPKKGPWTNHCIKIMVAKRENEESPAVDEKGQDPDGFCKTVALAGLLDSSAEAYSLKDKVEACIKTVQSNQVAVEYAVGGFNILENVIRSGEVDLDNICAVDNVKESVKKARDNNAPHKEAAKSWGLACGYPTSFIVGVHGIKCAENYVEAVRNEARAAGDNCSRVILVGSVCGAKYGLDAIPEDWLKKYSRTEEVLGYIETVVQL